MKSLSKNKQALLLFLSLLIVAFGQPAWVDLFGLITSAIGYAIFWRVLLTLESTKKKFWLGASWFAAVQLIQLSWFLSHPFYYIYIVYIFFAAVIGIQFGLLSLFVKPQNLTLFGMLGIAGFWTLMEWIRLFFMSGWTWNPVGLALASYSYPRQLASVWGVFGLSFSVMFVNLLALKAWIQGKKFVPWGVWLVAASIPYLYGMIHVKVHESAHAKLEKTASPYVAMLVQPAFSAEEFLGIPDKKNFLNYVVEEWRQILKITKKYLHEKVDLVALPEAVVPFGAYSFIYHYDDVKQAFNDILGFETLKFLPNCELPYAMEKNGKWLVTNAYWAQALANIFNANVVVGLEDAEEVEKGNRKHYSSALLFRPIKKDQEITLHDLPDRYSKRILVPMGEYIPFAFCRSFAAQYGIMGSFTCGGEAKVWGQDKLPFGVSICYEETFGNMMRDNRVQGAQFLLNITSDVWFPNSRLTKQHLEHSRLRTVELGIPLVRACNTGITSAIDSLGNVVSVLGNKDVEQEWLSDSILVNVPTYTYHTLYTHVGDWLIVGLSLLFVGVGFLTTRNR